MMAQKSKSNHIIRSKMKLIEYQADELHGVLARFIEKEIATVSVVNLGNHDLNALRIINSRLDVVLSFLLEKGAEINNFTSESVVNCQQQQQLINPNISDIPQNQIHSPIESAEFAVTTVKQNQEENEIKIHRLNEDVTKLKVDFTNLSKDNFSEMIDYIQEKQFCEKKNCSERINNIEVNLQHLASKSSDLSEENCCPVKEIIKQLETECVDIRSLLYKNETETTNLRKTTEDLASQIDTFKQHCGNIMTSLDTLSTKFKTDELVMNGYAAHQINEETQISNLQDRIHVVEEHRSKDLNFYEEKLEEVKSLYNQVCQMIASQVKPLQHLKDILSKYHQTKELQVEAAQQTSSTSADIGDNSLETGKLVPAYFGAEKAVTAIRDCVLSELDPRDSESLLDLQPIGVTVIK